MKYSLRVTLAGLYLLVPDEKLSAVHVLFPRHVPHGESANDDGHGASHDEHAAHGQAAHSSMPPHDAIRAFEQARAMPPILLNGYDLNLTGLTLDPDMPELPDEVFGLRDGTTEIACPREIACSANAGALFNARVTLRGGQFKVLASGKYKLPDGTAVELAGMLEWSIELPGRVLPSMPLLSLSRGEPSSLPKLEPRNIGTDAHTVAFGIVHAPEPIRVTTLEEIVKPKVDYGNDHLEMLYGVIPGVKDPVIPTPVPEGGAPLSTLWPNRCVGGKTK